MLRIINHNFISKQTLHPQRLGLITLRMSQFSSLNPHSETETTEYSTDSEDPAKVKNIIDPYKG
jgi:hypothetical protein